MAAFNIDVTKVRILIARTGLSQTEFARRNGIQNTSICRVLKRGCCTPAFALKLANALCIDLLDIATDPYLSRRDEKLFENYTKCGGDPAFFNLAAKKLGLTPNGIRAIIKKEKEKRKDA